MKLKIFFLLALLITALFAYPVGYYVLDGTQKIIDDKRIKSEKINIYVINLDSSKARYEYVQPAVKELGFETQRVSAVNGRMLPDA